MILCHRAVLTATLILTATAFPNVAVAFNRAPIYIMSSECGEGEAIRPKEYMLGCSGAGSNFSYANHVVYDHYGDATAVASATINVCLLSPPGVSIGPYTTWRHCPEADLSPQELAEYGYHALSGSFRFSHIVRCYSKAHRHESRLFYAEMSYKYADVPWTSHNYLTEGWEPSRWSCPGAPHVRR